MIIAKDEHNAYERQTRECKLIYKMNIILKETCSITLQCTPTNHTYINYIIKDSYKLNYSDLHIIVLCIIVCFFVVIKEDCLTWAALLEYTQG